MRRIVQRALLAAGLAAGALPAAAHHSYGANFDQNRTVELAGTVAELEYENPHLEFRMTVPGENGAAAREWVVDVRPNPARARAMGLTEAMLAPGARVSLTGWPARDGSRTVAATVLRVGERTFRFF